MAKRERKGREEEWKGKEEFCAVVIFPLGKKPRRTRLHRTWIVQAYSPRGANVHPTGSTLRVMHGCLGPRESAPKPHLDRFRCSAGFTFVPNIQAHRQTDRQTDRPRNVQHVQPWAASCDAYNAASYRHRLTDRFILVRVVQQVRCVCSCFPMITIKRNQNDHDTDNRRSGSSLLTLVQVPWSGHRSELKVTEENYF